jgi:heme-degrading monooxygenase HmoA
MYGTVALLRVKPGRESELLREAQEEDQQAAMPGYLYQFLYRLDEEPNTYYLVVIFDSKESYFDNAHSPGQHARYLRFRELLTADPEWHDGYVIYPPHLDRW